MTTGVHDHGEGPLACDFFETVTLSGARMYVLAVIEHASRGIWVLGATTHPTSAWVTLAAKDLAMDLEEVGCRARHMIRDRDEKFLIRTRWPASTYADAIDSAASSAKYQHAT
jgi:putative transposase